MAHTHKVVICRRCFSILSQCGCPELIKTREYVDCERCRAMVLIVEESPAEQRKRIAQFLSVRVGNFRKLNGDESLALAVFGWLVDAQLRIEKLEASLHNAEAAKS